MIPDEYLNAVAVIGMAGRFPKAMSVDELWQHLVAGRECLTELTDEQIRASGVSRADLENPAYVKRDALLEGQELFDAAFFDIGAREAEMIDPQHRLGLEVAWEALEDAGYDPARTGGAVGVFGGAGISTYFVHNLLPRVTREEHPDLLTLQIVMDKDFFTTRIAYKLDLRGPCLNIGTACSTSLVAIHVACQSLLNGECRLALAGGANIHVPRPLGYLFQEGSYRSPDGHCRAFDADGKGTAGGNGLGFVVLKRYEDALEDGDHVYAVVRGSAINNDGSGKIGFTAPSIDGQARAIAEALAVAQVDAETIRYVETHGTGTSLGDPIEVAALTQAFRVGTDERQFCAIGSIKPNIGHLGAAAGVAGFIKAARAVEARTLPASLNYTRPNPAIDFATSPFFVNDRLTEIPPGPTPLRAGVSSFGIGGTNAHAILEEPPAVPPPAPGRTFQVLPVSAKTEASLAETAARVRAHVERLDPALLPDAAYTLQIGRHPMPLRRAFVATAGGIRAEVAGTAPKGEPARVAFLFPGGGTQYLGMGRGLYRDEPVFRAALDRCAAIARPELGVSLAEAIYEGDAETLRRTSIALPSIFAIEHALAMLWRAWGVEPTALLGHSLGEYTAACVAGVLPVEHMMRLVCLRGRLLENMETGAMLGVPATEAELAPFLSAEISLAAVNGPASAVLSGTRAAIDRVEAALVDRGIEPRRIVLDTAGHSSLVEPMLAELTALVRTMPLAAPKIPYVSNVTGTWITPAEATDPQYYARHLRETVRFAAGIRTILEEGPTALLEVGPGTALTSFARQQVRAGDAAIASMRHPREEKDDAAALAEALGRLWVSGAPIAWSQYRDGEKRRRIRMPTYAFDRQRYWIEAGEHTRAPANAKLPLDDWFSVPVWRRIGPARAAEQNGPILVLAPTGPGGDLARALAAGLGNAKVTVASHADAFRAIGDGTYELDTTKADDYRALFAALSGPPATIVHLLTFGQDDVSYRAHTSLVHLAQALDTEHPVEIIAITSGLERVHEDDRVDPHKALLVGPARVIPYELPRAGVRIVDVGAHEPALVERLVAEIGGGGTEREIAYRKGARYAKDYVRATLPADEPSRLVPGGAYLVTGGMGGMGMTIAKELARRGARIALVSRSHASAPVLPGAADVLVVSADLGEAYDVAALAATVQARFGAIDGIFHCAGLNHEATIPAVEPAGTKRVFDPKVRGTELLWEHFSGPSLRFFLLCSSLSTATSSFGGVDYVSANAFLDAFATRHADASAFVAAIDWDIWDDVGMVTKGDLKSLLPYLDEEHIAPTEGVAVFLRVLASGYPRIVVSTRDFATIRRKNEAIFRKSAAAPATPTAKKRYPRPTLGEPFAPPSTEAERQLVAIWEDVLGVAPVGVDDNFFALGGESVVAVQVLAKLKQAGLRITPRQMFEGPTIAQMAKHLTALEPGAPITTAPPSVVAAPAEEAFPPTPLQALMLREGALDKPYRSYVNQSVIELFDRVDGAWLRDVWQRVVDRTPALRIAFVDGPLQIVRPSATLPFEETAWTVKDREEAEARMQDLLVRDRARGFAVDTPPLLRITHVHLEGGVVEDRVLVTSHHAIVDGWSSGLMMQELFAAAMKLPPNDAPCGAFRDLLAWRRARGGEAEALRFWQETLEGYHPAQLFRPPPSPGAPHVEEELSLGASLTQALGRAARDARVTLNTIIQAAWAASLGELGATRDVVFGITVAGRPSTLEHVATIVGQCTSTLPLRVHVPEAPTVAWLRELHAASVAVMEHDHVGLDAIEAGRGALYETNLIFENVPMVDPADVQVPGFRIRRTYWSEGWHFPLRLFVFPGDALALRLAYDATRVRTSDVARLVERFRAHLLDLAGGRIET